MAVLLALLAPTPEGYGVGIEWMAYASFAVPALILIVIWLVAKRRIV